MNFAHGIEIKFSEKHGRGLFATKDFKKGELILGEKATAFAKGDENSLLVKCFDIVEYGGIEALRLSYLFDGKNT